MAELAANDAADDALVATVEQATDEANRTDPLLEAGEDDDEVTKAMLQQRTTMEVQNVVATVNLKTPLDLRKLSTHARNAEYNPRKFSAVVMRVREPRCTALVFQSGKLVCTGAKSEAAAKRGARIYAAIIAKIGFPVQFTGFRLQNVVATVNVGFPIRLEALAFAHNTLCVRAGAVSGLIYRLLEPKTVILTFVSGRIVLTGARSVAQLHEAFRKVYPLLNEFRKQCVGPYRAPPAPRIGPDYLAVVPAPAPAAALADAAAAARAAAGHGHSTALRWRRRRRLSQATSHVSPKAPRDRRGG